MTITEAIRRRRTIRLFEQKPISREVLRGLVEAARVAPSAANLQPLEYVLVDDPAQAAALFPCLGWAGYVKPRRDPPEGKRPAAYLAVLINREVRTQGGEYDVGAAVENILLAALEQGIGGCWIGSVNQQQARRILELPEHLELDSVVALGYPAEQPVLEEAGDSIRYWLDDQDVLHVPKRPIAQVLHENRWRE